MRPRLRRLAGRWLARIATQDEVDCEPVLAGVGAIVMDLHEFDAANRQAPRVLELLTRNGFTYVVDEFVPQPWRPPVTSPDTPFPGKALIWSMTVRAWRA